MTRDQEALLLLVKGQFIKEIVYSSPTPEGTESMSGLLPVGCTNLRWLRLICGRVGFTCLGISGRQRDLQRKRNCGAVVTLLCW
jgi:hypothetical protein